MVCQLPAVVATISCQPPAQIYLFAATTHDGNLQGDSADARTGADAIVSAKRPPSLAGKTVHAFISINETDCIKNMPVNFGFPADIPIISATDGTTVIADNWDDLLDGSIDIALQNAFPMPASFGWWSGSKTDGSYSNSYNNCYGWTTHADGEGAAGNKDAVNYEWINFAYGEALNSLYVLGIAY